MVIMRYKDHIIEAERGHYKVTSPHGAIWRTDTVTEAKHDIDVFGDRDELEEKERVNA